jgi:hypothetical protein
MFSILNNGVSAAVLLELLYLFTQHLRLLKIKIKSSNSDGFSTGLVCTDLFFFFFLVIIKRLPYYTDKLISLSVFILLQLMDLLASRKSLQIKFSPGMVLPNMIPFGLQP